MASREHFEGHCWKDVMPADEIRLYAPYTRETFVGPSAAFLAIDLCDLVYRGGFAAKAPRDAFAPAR